MNTLEKRLVLNLASVSLIQLTFLLPTYSHRYIRRLFGDAGASVASTRAPGIIFCTCFLIRELISFLVSRRRHHHDKNHFHYRKLPALHELIKVTGVVGMVTVVLLPITSLFMLRALGNCVMIGGRLWVAAWSAGAFFWVVEALIGFTAYGMMEEAIADTEWKGIIAFGMLDAALLGIGTFLWKKWNIMGWKKVYEIMVALVGISIMPWIVDRVGQPPLRQTGYDETRPIGLKFSLTRKKSRRKGGRRFQRRLRQWLLILGLVFWCVMASRLSHKVVNITDRLKDSLPSDLKLREVIESVTGRLAVVERDYGKFKARFLLCDHSVIGGRYFGVNVHDDSIYSQFYVQEAVRLTRRRYEELDKCSDEDGVKCEQGVPTGGREGRTLAIGAGVGITANALTQLGSIVDLVEIDPEVLRLAQRYFGLHVPKAHLFAEDALDFIARTKTRMSSGEADGDKYEYVIHDVFTGGSVPLALFRRSFFEDLKMIMKEDAVLALNFVGSVHGSPVASGGVLAVLKLLMDTWSNVRIFSDEHTNSTGHNYVVFASDVPERVTFRKPVLRDTLSSQMRFEALNSFQKWEVRDARRLVDEYIGLHGKREEELLHAARWVSGAAHWHIMRKLFPLQLWEHLL